MKKYCSCLRDLREVNSLIATSNPPTMTQKSPSSLADAQYSFTSAQVAALALQNRQFYRARGSGEVRGSWMLANEFARGRVRRASHQ
jgi:hypothetical protein